MTACLVCLAEVDSGEYHAKCLRSLFGTSRLPAVEFDLSKLHRVGLEMVGRVSLSGVQQKVALGISEDRSRFEVRPRARFILKPQVSTLPHVPENEHATMRLAALVGLETPPCGLLRLADGSLAYVVARFDRPAEGGKRRQEDFCQLARLPTRAKYDGSAEDCVKLVRRFATDPVIEILRFFQQFAFAWWTGNGDAHLKNFSVVEDGADVRLSPVYDQLCTRLVIPGDDLSMTVKGRKERLTHATWRYFAEYAGLPGPAAARALEAMSSRTEEATGLVSRSFLPGPMRREYAELLRDRGAVLAEAASQLRVKRKG